jgi:hypothetical protein
MPKHETESGTGRVITISPSDTIEPPFPTVTPDISHLGRPFGKLSHKPTEAQSAEFRQQGFFLADNVDGTSLAVVTSASLTPIPTEYLHGTAAAAPEAGESEPAKNGYRAGEDLRNAIRAELEKRKKSKNYISPDELIDKLAKIGGLLPCPIYGNLDSRTRNQQAVSAAVGELRKIDGLNITKRKYLLSD